jgi:hypothetical protein
MANTTISANMLLPVPIVGVETGPNWATDINSCLAIVDQHNHAPGSGVQINPSGLNINADLAINSNNLTLIRSSKFVPQVSALALGTDIGCVYVNGVDLYYNDVNGNQIRLTQSGSIAGTAGSISGLVSPATASYVVLNTAFVFQSAANTSALVDCGSIKLRNSTASSKALTLNPPAAMGADISQTLPVIPASATSIMQMDTSGNMTAVLKVDNSTLQNTSNTLSVKGNLTQAMKAAMPVGTSVSVGGFAQSNSLSAGPLTSTTPALVSGTFSITITTSGRPVFLFLMEGSPGSASSIAVFNNTNGSLISNMYVYNATTATTSPGVSLQAFGGIGNPNEINIPPGGVNFYDFPVAGTYTYQLYYSVNPSSSLNIVNTRFCAYEI